MSNSINGKEYSLSKIFSKSFEFHIPSYQRPYAWTEDETNLLFDDLYDFYSNSKEENYFLGSIVLVKDEDKAFADVIDGQQRLTTLTILLANIASRFEGTQRDQMAGYIYEPGNDFEDIKASPRLFLRDKDQPFFNQYVQNLQIEELASMDAETLDSESKKHIVSNCKELKKRIDSIFTKDLENNQLFDFAQFLLTKCFLIAVSTPNQSSAFRIFSVMNSRGLDLLPVDIIKAQIIGKLEPQEQRIYTDKWEDMELEVTRSGFNELFGDIRMIYSRVKPQKTLIEEFDQYVMPNIKNGKDFIDHILEPYAEVYQIIKGCSYKSTGDNDKINNTLKWLNRVDNSDWIPISIKFLAENKNDADYVSWFFKKLERLVSFLLVTSKDVNYRIKRYHKLFQEIDDSPGHCVETPLTSLELTDNEKEEFFSYLSGDIYKMTSKRRNYIILRLNSFVSDEAFELNPKILTIEHVLPQTVDSSSQWNIWWPEESDRINWVHKIANLVPLTRRANSAAQNYDFENKKTKYFKSPSGTSSFPLTTQVLNYTEWKKKDLISRQKDLLSKFAIKWELSCDIVNSLLESFEEDSDDDTESSFPFLTEKSILIAEIPKSGSRWKQVNFSKYVFQVYFGADEKGSGHDIFITNIRPDGSKGQIETRRLVSVVSHNYRIEISCEETEGQYPKGGKRPIVIFREIKQYHFYYQVFLPYQPNYHAVYEALNKLYTGGGTLKRQITNTGALKSHLPELKLLNVSTEK
ncbi:MAG: DUF262 domain-containing protein [Alphaproteobacteria bacterium]|nr:DUF262 domain-containing protein [Alphaproteobacteria bacterium]